MKDLSNLNEMHLDVLKEIGSIGSGNAATSLAKMLNKRVRMFAPAVKWVEFKDITGFIGGPDNTVAGILVFMSGEINGMVVFLLTMESAQTIVKVITDGMYADRANASFNEIERSALTEIGNILINAYVGSLAGFTHTRIVPTVPYLCIDMANAILSVPAIEFGKVANKALLIESSFSVEDQSMAGYFVLVPDMPSFTRIMHELGI